MARFQLSLASHSSSEDKEEGEEEEEESESECGDLIPSPLILPGSAGGGEEGTVEGRHHQFSVVAALVAALRKSLVMCSVGAGEDGPCSSMEIGCPMDVRHIAHVTFDRFDGFLGLPVEFQPDVPGRVPSASASVFGVSATSMQCSYDSRGNSVPTILLSMQRHLYTQGGLQVEGIFRINAENSQEVYVRDQLNKGIVPHGIDLHCLAGLIKAWFRELPTGVLDSLTPDQVMHCNTEEECSQLVRLLPPTEAALLNWAINLMADVVEHEHHNKMNARNIAMVFAPNMTLMADPLTALLHAVQVMNFLKTLILKALQERKESAADSLVLQLCAESPSDEDRPNSFRPAENSSVDTKKDEETLESCAFDRNSFSKFLISSGHAPDSDVEGSFKSFEKSEVEDFEHVSETTSPIGSVLDVVGDASKSGYNEVDRFLDRLSLREGMKKLCRHPVFQLSKSTKNAGEVGMVDSSEEGREAWA